ncbi:unnamed protein product [Durusdinium trenchii]|uniref:Uncharacterized protein n=1 Tax=Durusdinium trenchii TaxID=1381693 RepID=A0ABP0QRQ4_9DINO
MSCDSRRDLEPSPLSQLKDAADPCGPSGPRCSGRGESEMDSALGDDVAQNKKDAEASLELEMSSTIFLQNRSNVPMVVLPLDAAVQRDRPIELTPQRASSLEEDALADENAGSIVWQNGGWS